MSELSHIAQSAARAIAAPQAEPLPLDVVNNIFKVLHGRYGNLFLSKFATGELDERGKDKGIASARKVWAHDLRVFDAKTIGRALDLVPATHPDFPPSLPQFMTLCRAETPAKRPETLQVEISGAALAQATKQAREAAIARINASRRAIKVEQASDGLDALKQAIANAVATAGGDEVAELRRLDHLFAPAEA